MIEAILFQMIVNDYTCSLVSQQVSITKVEAEYCNLNKDLLEAKMYEYFMNEPPNENTDPVVLYEALIAWKQLNPELDYHAQERAKILLGYF